MKIIISFILLFNILYAHPHTFIEVFPAITIKDSIVQKINFIWKLDEMTSAMLIMEFDSNTNGIIDQTEQEFVYQNYFSSLHASNFYTDITVKGKVQKFPNPKKFYAFIENNKLCYSFDIDTNLNIDETLFDFGDTDFYIAMILKKEFVEVNDAKVLISDLDNDFYFGYRLELK
jgi:ABC-type uncharacterized transport system substrate-binding protein